MLLGELSEMDVDNRIDDELVVAAPEADDRANLHREAGLGEWRRLVAEFEVHAVEEIALLGMRRHEQRSQFEGVRIEALVLKGERQIEADLPPVGHTVSEFRRAVEAVVGSEAAGKGRVLLTERDVVQMLLDRELADLGDPGVVDLDLVGRARGPTQGQQGQCGRKACDGE